MAFNMINYYYQSKWCSTYKVSQFSENSTNIAKAITITAALKAFQFLTTRIKTFKLKMCTVKLEYNEIMFAGFPVSFLYGDDEIINWWMSVQTHTLAVR
jgi:hypothetical protein